MEEISTTDRVAGALMTGANTLKGAFWLGEQKLLITLGFCKSSDPQTVADRIHGIVLNLPFLIYAMGKACGVSHPLFYGFGALPLGVTFMLAGIGLHQVAQLLHSREWTLWKGEGKVIEPAQVKVMHLNACMFPGSLPYHFGKQFPATERLEKLEKKIQSEGPHLFFLCEMGQQFSIDLYDRLKDNYHLFVVNVGGSTDLCFASKIDIETVQFVQSQIPRIGDQKLMNRGYLVVEMKDFKIVYTHLHPQDSEEAQEVRKRQIIDEVLPLMESEKPALLVGDLNIDRNKNEYQLIQQHFTDLNDKTITCQEGEETESVDYILTLEGETRLTLPVPKIDLDLTLSDHATLTSTVTLAKKTD